jgi:hypothetical protein
MQSINDDFYFAIDFDDDGRLKNVFWADARSRTAYEDFGDVVTFDTTYLTNKYKMPFAFCGGESSWSVNTFLCCININGEYRDVYMVV